MMAISVSQTPEQKQKRFAMFAQFDPNGNGYLSLAEVDKVCSADGMLANKSLLWCMRSFTHDCTVP